jgi:signal transduction histidine kinase
MTEASENDGPRGTSVQRRTPATVLRPRRGGHEPRIVVVDDDDTNVLLLTRLLARSGYADVFATGDPVEAVELMLRDPPDLLLLDLRMPVLDGYEVLEQIAPLLRPPHELPVLVLSADLTTEARHRALSAGARDFLTKPFDLVELSLRVANLLETSDLHRRLRDQNERLETAVADRTTELARLSADLAHEVRTPLYAIRGIAEVLLHFEDGLPDRLRDDIAQIDGIAVLALDLVDREIAAAKAAAGRTLPAPAEVDVAAVLDELRDVMSRTTRTEGVRLEIADGSGVPRIVTDAARLGQVLRNLVANALGTVTEGVVRVDVESVDDGERIAFHVRDTGPGVASEDRERIFARFEQGPGRTRGAGIGLPIARRIARLLGGDVTVAESEDGGTADGGAWFTATVATRLPDPSSEAETG